MVLACIATISPHFIVAVEEQVKEHRRLLLRRLRIFDFHILQRALHHALRWLDRAHNLEILMNVSLVACAESGGHTL